ncbi:MAG TPA: MG2 domain-containing protein [Kofleriaceae bacterium]|jgi:hypothetical protein
MATGRIIASCAFAAALVACHSKSKLDDVGHGPPPGVAASSAAGSNAHDAGPARPPVTAAALQPLIHELGMAHALPTAIVIELAAPITDQTVINSTSAKSVIKLTPEIAGRLSYTNRSELTFTPARPFAFDTTYTIDVDKIETRDGVIAHPANQTWSYSFKTPKFQLVSFSPIDVDTANHRVVADIVFSGPVLPNIARAAMTFAVAGHAPTAVTLLPSHDANTITVRLDDPKLALGAKVAMSLKAGLPSALGAKAAGANVEFAISTDNVVSIKNAYLVEGATGFFLEVVCNDSAAPAGHRYSYVGEGYYDLSARCQLTDDAIDKIHFTPAVKKTYITNGKTGFRVFGEFNRGTYTVTIDGGAPSVDGGVVLAPFSRTFSVAARRPQLSFVGTGRYLPRTAWTNLGIKHLNVDRVALTVRQVPPENLIFYLGDDNNDALDERTSDLILRKELPLDGAADAPTTTWLDVASLLPATTRGVLELQLSGGGVATTSRLLLTNMSLVAKKTADPGIPSNQKVHVWALDMDSAGSLDGVEVSLVRKSGKVVARCTTSGDQGCTLDSTDDRDPDNAEPFALIARKGDDLTYIRYSDLRADVAESTTSGTPYVSDLPYRASIYADRGVYRPGDTVHVAAIVRDGADRAPATPLPVDVTVVDPRGKTVRKVALKTNAAGMLSIDQQLAVFADTGHWRVQLEVAGNSLGDYDVQVEEFVPERMKVTLAPKQPDLLVGQPLTFAVSAQYLFGGSAADSGVELSCTAEPVQFAPPANTDFLYGVRPRGKQVNLGDPEKDQLDAKGTVEINCPAGETSFTQTQTITATASVLEAGSGRATVASSIATVHPEKFYIGLKTHAVQAESGTRFGVDGIVVDWQGKPLAGTVKSVDVQLVHLEADYGYGYDDSSGEDTYDRYLRRVPEGKLTAQVDGTGHFHFDVTPGEAEIGYVVRVTAGKAKTELELPGSYPYDYYAGYDQGDRVDRTPRPAKPTQLHLKLPKELEVGKPTSVSIVTPYKGRVLWTVETDHVVTYAWKDVAAGDASWSFTLDAFTPNVYVSAFLVKDPHLESKLAFLPDRAYGITSVRVLPTALTQAVTIIAPKEVRSSSPLTITLDVGATSGPTFATIAVVDEGILSLTRFKSPDPLAQLFAQRALGVETFETIGWTMLHNPAGASSRTGGGDEGGEAQDQGALAGGRVQPVKPVALWSGIVAVGADGKATVPFQIPSYRGQVRVMAVVAGPTKIGHAEADVTVRDPLVVQATFPRFVTQNDEIQIPVFLTNMSGGPLNVTVKVDSVELPVAGLAPHKGGPAPLAFAGKDTGSARIENGKSETLVFQAKATLPAGGATLRVVATAGNLKETDTLDVPFLPAGPKERVVQKIRLATGALDLATQQALKNWVPTSESTSFWMTNNPFPESFQNLDYLIHYPFGCIEQTASSTRPLLYVAGLAEQVDPKLAELRIEDMVIGGINRIFSMETPSGGFGYWPGATEPLEWATAYATDTLLDAKKAGYAVPDDRLKEVLAWIEARVNAYERGEKIIHEPWNHYDEQSEAYLHYVLARAGKGKKARILKLIGDIPAKAVGEQAEDLYMLKAALYLAGDRRYAADLKAVDSSPIQDLRINSWSFYSDRRRRGEMLSIFFDLFGADPAGEPLANRVAETLATEPGYYYNTQELVWGVTGLGKWVMATAGKGAAGGTLVADGQTITPHKQAKGSSDRTWSVQRASEYKALSLDVPAGANGMWLVISSEGVRPNATYKTGGNGLEVSRSYHLLDATEIAPSAGTLHLGDLVFVEIDLENTSAQVIQNIALVDRLPAGFEIENPRLGRTTKPDWVKDDEQWPVDFMNMRDDRIEAFGTLAPHQSKKIIYTVRAVTAGKFAIPPIEAGAMYDPTLWARGAADTAVIGGPWTGKLL